MQPEAVPFEEILQPILEMGRRKLRAALDTSSAAGSAVDPPDAVWRGFMAALQRRLAELFGRVLQHEFSRHRPSGYGLLHLFDVSGSDSPERHFYDSFVQRFARDGLEPLFDRYPALGRLCATVVDMWAEAAVEFAVRLDQDKALLEHHFGGGEGLGPIVEFQGGLSDPHDRGRCIHILTFHRGVKVVYKPRDVGIELAFARFVESCNQRSGCLPLRVLQILDRPGYGWVEHVEHTPCADHAAAERLYQRAGTLLCLVYALRGTDCHYQNIVVSNDQIVLIDAEAMMLPPMDQGACGWPVRPGTDVLEAFSYTVLSTALLPTSTFHEDGLAYDLSGLTGVAGQRLPGFFMQWKDVGSDMMRIEPESRVTEEHLNSAYLNGIRLSPEHFVGFIIRGFTEMYQFLLENRAHLLQDGPLRGFCDRPIRVILRDTAEYGHLLQYLCAPEQLQQEVDVGVELGRLAQGALLDREGKRRGELERAEIRALEGLDVPCFRALSTSLAISIGGDRSVDDFFHCSGFDAALMHVQRLGHEDLALQVALIEGAFHAHSARVEATSGDECSYDECSRSAASVSPTRDHLLGEAARIAEEIERAAWICTDGAAHWLGLNYYPRARRFQFQILADCICNGNCGIALFLAALDHVAPRPRFRSLVAAALLPLRRFKSDADERAREELARRIGIGAAAGAGALIYGLTRIGRLISDKSLYEDARWYAEMITPDTVGRDMHFGILSGAAGAIAGLLALHGETGDETLLRRASICATHLLERRNAIERPSLGASATAPESHLASLADGSLGIELLLRRLHALCPAEKYWYGAHDAFALDIGLEQVAAGDDLEAQIAVDGLCFGHFGQIELMLLAGEALSDARLCNAARIRAGHLASRARALGGYKLFANLPRSVFNPGLLLGSAGIGYSLLRLAAGSKTLPSVLLWE